MTKKTVPLWIYGSAAFIFLFVAAINGWMIVAEGSTTFRIIAAVAFFIGGILLLFALMRRRRQGS